MKVAWGGAKTFATTAQHQAVVWSIGFSGYRHRKVSISVNGIGLSGSTNYTNTPKQSTNSLNIFSNRGQSAFPQGFVGEFIVVNNLEYPGGGGVQEYLQRKWLGENYDHDAFFLDSNGTLLTNRPLDYEVDEQNQTIQIIASTGSRQSLPQEFTVSITNVVEDLDGDGLEDFHDSDSDGDGVSNLQEFLGRSDPLNSSSNNAAPSEINATGSLSFSETLALGTIAVDFNATDTNSDANLTYRVQQNINISDVPGISAWFDASNLDSITTDLSGKNVLSWANISNNAVNLEVHSRSPSVGAQINGLHALFFDKNESLISRSGNSLWNPWSRDGSLNGQFKDGAFFIVVRCLEHGRFGLPNLGNFWSGTFPWTNGDFHWDIWRNAEVNRIWGPLTGIEENLLLTLNHSVTNSVRYFSKNGSIISSGYPVISNNYGPIIFPNINNEPSYIVGETIFVREFLNEADRAKIEGYLTHKWSLADQLPSDHPYASIDFTIDENGSLRTAREFDYETDDHNYSVRIWATDEHNATTYNDFTVTLNNVVEDLDGDGTEDHYDLDIDGDGLSNADELLYNSDPWDASSINRPPSDINVSNLTIAENSAIGTVIGEFNATDPDGEGNFTYSLRGSPFVDYNLSDDSKVILWLDAAVDSTVIQSNGLVSQWMDRSGNGNHATQTSSSVMPTYLATGMSGFPAIDFSSDKLLFPSLNMLGKTLLAIIQADRVDSARQIFSNSSTNVQLRIANGLLNYASTNPIYANSRSTEVVPINEMVMVEFILGEKMGFSVNGTENYGADRGSSGKTTFNQIGTREGNYEQFDGKMGELIVLNSVSLSDRQKIEGYLANKWGLEDRFPADHPAMVFSMDANGTLTANQSFDYETDDLNYTITVRATDDHNISFDKNFTISVTNVVEDLDGDGTEDHYDLDIDGDGLSNADELLYNSDPWDASSINRPPSDINASNLTIAENSAIGTVIGEFNATDPDGEGNFTFSVQSVFADPSNISGLNAWFDASDISTIVTEEGSSDVITWANKLDASVKMHSGAVKPQSNFSINGLNAISSDHALGVTPMIAKENNSTEWNPMGENGAVSGTADEFSIFLAMKFLENGTCKFPFGLNFDAPSSYNHFNWSNGHFYWRFSDARRSFQLANEGAPFVLSLETSLTKSSQTAFYNGLQQITGTRDSAVPITGGFSFPAEKANAGVPANTSHTSHSVVGEILVVNEVISDNNRQQIEGYLASKWGLVDQLPNSHLYSPNHLFSFDVNGSLRTVRSLDYEVDEHNYTVRVEVLDDRNASYYEDFNITLTNVVEDLDGDGIEDHNDTDIDGDGLTNAEELAHNSDPWDANSSNRPPSDINASNLTIAENAAIGAVIGEFNATDPDGDTNITFSILNGSGSEMGWSSSRLFGDSDSGVSPDLNYTCAVNVNGSNKVVNGVTFLGTSGTSGDGWAITAGFKSLHSSETSSVSGNIGQVLSNGFRHSGNPQKIKMTGLTVGRNYVFSLYNQGWGVGTSRSCSLSCSALSGSVLINQDKYGDQNPDGHLVRCFYTANAEEVEFTFNPVTSATWHLYAFSNHEGIPFALDDNGTLTTLKSFDYETDDLNYSITVRATDDHNVSFDKNFTISVTNVVEDLDGDGTEDHYDDDIDGDGLSDADEAMLGSDPLNGSSPVVPATSFKPKNTLTVSEDAAVGTVVGQFERLEISASPIKSYELIPHLPTSANPVLWLDASELNYAGETWQDKSLSNNHATRNGSAQGFPTILKNFQNGHSVMHYNGAPMAYHDFEEIGNVRTVFWAVARSLGSGSLLGDSDSSQFFSGTDQFWFNGMADSKVLSGDTFLRGRKIDGSSTPVPSSLEVISFRSSADLNASRFGRSSNGRAFIGELGELIIFNQSLANWQMAQIERYLAQKWSLPIDRSVSEFSIDAEGVVRSAIKFNFDDTSSRSLLVRATNENNQSVINSHMVAITDVTGGASVSDIDGDGMSNELELTLGYDPYDANSKNTTPANLRSSNDLGILESVSVGSVIGKLIADDPDYLSELTYSFSTGEGAGDNSKVSISEGGEIKLLTSLDYEKQTSLSFRAKVVDENNASIEKAFTLSVIDIFEDENNNGVEDHLESDMDGDGIPNESDPDRDGDGVSNGDELQNGSDPDNAKSTNRPPTNLVNSSALSIQENQPKGAVISKFVPQDPDGVQGYSYLLVEGTGGTDNGLFEIDQHGNLSTSVVFDYENNASSYSVRMKAEDPYGKSVEKAFSIALANSDQFSPISIDADLMLWLDASDKSTLEKSNSLGGAGQPKDGESVKFWADKSGQGHHAITSNSGTYLENSLNECYPSIDTTGDTFELVDSAESFDAWSEMTISMVYQYSSESSWILGIWKHGNGNGNHIQGGWSFDRMNMNVRSVGLWWAKASMVDGEHAARLMGGDSFGSKQSAKVITMRYDGSSTNLKYFANGRFIQESNETEPSFVSNLSETLKIGNSYKWGEVLIFRSVLPD
ncbi:hypothetical protein N9N55_06870, partial [Opitutales bacterium]|nr:hypothetical protein [Opitutales bacterium]